MLTLHPYRYHRPSTLAAALDLLQRHAGDVLPIAGGTDLVVGARHGKADLPADLVAIDRVTALDTVETGPEGTTIGALVAHARLMTDPVVVGCYTAVADAAALVGSPATRS